MKKKQNTNFRVSCVYNSNLYPKMDDTLEKKTGLVISGSGMGFGIRDVSWSGPRDKMQAIVKVLSNIKEIEDVTLTEDE